LIGEILEIEPIRVDGQDEGLIFFAVSEIATSRSVSLQPGDVFRIVSIRKFLLQELSQAL